MAKAIIDMLARNYILPADLEDFLPPSRAAQAFEVLDLDGDGQLTLPELRDAVTKILK